MYYIQFICAYDSRPFWQHIHIAILVVQQNAVSKPYTHSCMTWTFCQGRKVCRIYPNISKFSPQFRGMSKAPNLSRSRTPVDRASNHSPSDCWWQSLNREAQIPFNSHFLKHARSIHLQPLNIDRSKLLFPECQWTEDANCSASWFGLVRRIPRASRGVNTKTFLNPLNFQTQNCKDILGSYT